LTHKYGSIKLGCKALGLNFTNNRRYNESDLIGSLRSFVIKYKRMPYVKDCFDELPSITTFMHRFGSWNKARIMAGLDQLLAEVKGGEINA